MTPQAATAPMEGAGGGKELPGGLLPSLLADVLEMPFASALADLQSPLPVIDSRGKDPVCKDSADQITTPAVPIDPSTAALAAVLQWLRQSAPAALPPATDSRAATTALTDAPVLAGVTTGTAAVAAVLPALLAAHFKGATHTGSGAIADGSADSGADQAVGTPAPQGSVGSQGVATAIGNVLTADLRGLANLLNLATPDVGSARPHRDEAGATSLDPPATTGGTAASGIDTLTSAVASPVASGERTSITRTGVDVPAPQSERVVSVPVHDRRWSQAIAAQVLILADHRLEGATLRLTPEHLGPVEVRIDFQDSQVNVNFGAAHSDTRTALEQALPRLREVLAGAGLTLGEASVQQQMRRGPQNRGEGQRTATAMADQQPVTTVGALHAIRMIDEYA